MQTETCSPVTFKTEKWSEVREAPLAQFHKGNKISPLPWVGDSWPVIREFWNYGPLDYLGSQGAIAGYRSWDLTPCLSDKVFPNITIELMTSPWLSSFFSSQSHIKTCIWQPRWAVLDFKGDIIRQTFKRKCYNSIFSAKSHGKALILLDSMVLCFFKSENFSPTLLFVGILLQMIHRAIAWIEIVFYVSALSYEHKTEPLNISAAFAKRFWPAWVWLF